MTLLSKIKVGIENEIVLLSNNSNRERAWEHCYKAFGYAREQGEPCEDYLAMHLTCYLASFGMYRGSSFLAKSNYTVHKPAIEIIMKYKMLYGIDCEELKNQYYMELLFDLVKELGTHYREERSLLKGEHVKQEVSDTLITKVLLGTLGCVPAYDEKVMCLLRTSEEISSGSFGKRSLIDLIEFYKKNSGKLEELRSSVEKASGYKPTQMRLIDMGLWGYNL